MNTDTTAPAAITTDDALDRMRTRISTEIAHTGWDGAVTRVMGNLAEQAAAMGGWTPRGLRTLESYLYAAALELVAESAAVLVTRRICDNPAQVARVMRKALRTLGVPTAAARKLTPAQVAA